MGTLALKSKHRIVCGDSRDDEAIGRALGGEPASLALTDPPYGLGDTVSDKNDYDLHSDTREDLRDIVDKVFPIIRQRCDVVVLTPGNSNQFVWPQPNWVMAWFTPAGIGSGPWGFCCWQPIYCYGKDPKLAQRQGSHPDAIVHTESAADVAHPCPKPLNFWCWLMERCSKRGDLIIDPFLGSGTSILAAERLGRRCVAVELSPAYCDVSIIRYLRETSGIVVHAETLAQFPEQPDG